MNPRFGTGGSGTDNSGTSVQYCAALANAEAAWQSGQDRRDTVVDSTLPESRRPSRVVTPHVPSFEDPSRLHTTPVPTETLKVQALTADWHNDVHSTLSGNASQREGKFTQTVERYILNSRTHLHNGSQTAIDHS